MNNDELREAAGRSTKAIFVYLQHYITAKRSMCDGVKRIIIEELAPLIPAVKPPSQPGDIATEVAGEAWEWLAEFGGEDADALLALRRAIQRAIDRSREEIGPAPEPVDDKELAAALGIVKTWPRSVPQGPLLVDAAKYLANVALRAAQLEAKELRATNDGPWNMISNIADTLRARGFEEGQVDERVIAMAQALDKARDSQQEVAELRKDVKNAASKLKLAEHKLSLIKNAAFARGGSPGVAAIPTLLEIRNIICGYFENIDRTAGEGKGAT